MENVMADDDEVVSDDVAQDDGPEGEGAEGQDSGAGDDDGEVSAERTDAPSGEDDGPSHIRAEGDGEKPLSRGGNRFQRLSNDNAALREELAAARREREADRQARQAQEQNWTQQQWQERWNAMPPEEKIEAAWQQGQQQINNLQQQFGTQLQLMKDQTAYEAKATVNPVYARHKDEVEEQYQSYSQRGMHIPRETILKQMLGEKALASASRSTSTARRQGQKKIEAQTTRPTSNKGDAASSRGKQGDTAEKRLAGVEI
jgi:hypothetical protein